MPFGEYDDFDSCVRENNDKRDPEAYCAAIKRQIEGASALSDSDRDAIQAADGFSDRLLDDDPCWEDYTMVGTKVENGQVVPNCVPDDEVPDANLAAADERCGEGMVKIGDRCVPVNEASESVDAPASILSDDAAYLTLKSLESEPIERVEAGDNTVRYTNVKLLSPGIWADAGSQTETYYPPDGIASLEADYDDAAHDGPPLISCMTSIPTSGRHTRRRWRATLTPRVWTPTTTATYSGTLYLTRQRARGNSRMTTSRVRWRTRARSALAARAWKSRPAGFNSRTTRSAICRAWTAAS